MPKQKKRRRGEQTADDLSPIRKNGNEGLDGQRHISVIRNPKTGKVQGLHADDVHHLTRRAKAILRGERKS